MPEIYIKDYDTTVSFDDSVPMSEIQTALAKQFPAKEESSVARRYVADPAISALKGAIAMPEAFVGLADIPTGGRVGKALETVGYEPKKAKEILNTLYSPEQKKANRKVSEAEGFVDKVQTAIENPSTIAHTVIESVPSMIGGAGIAKGLVKGASRLPKVAKTLEEGGAAAQKYFIRAGAAGEGAISAGSTAEQVREESKTGALTAKQAALSAGSGALTGLMTLAGGKIANYLKIGDVDTLLAGGVNLGTKKNILRRVIESALSEGVLEELPQSAQEQVAQNLAQGKPWNEGVADSMAMGLLSGGVMGGFGGAGVIERLSGKQQAAEQTTPQEQTEQAAPPEPTMPGEEAPAPAQSTPVTAASPTPYDDLIQTSAAKHGVDPALVKAVIQAESGFKNGLTSPKGAAGLMQLMPGTAKMLGVDDVMNPADNIDGGVEYLAALLRKFGGDEAKAVAAYNWGPGNLIKHGLEKAPKETRDYLAKIQASKAKFGGGAEAMAPQQQPANADPKQPVILFKNAIQTGSIPLQEAIAKRGEIISEFPEEEDEINKAIIDAQASRPLAGIAQEETPIITEAQPATPSSAIAQSALPQQNEVEITELQNRIAQQQNYLDTHQGYRGTEIYKTWQDTLVQDKVKLAELTGGIPVNAQTPQVAPASLPAQPEIVQSAPSSQEAAGSRASKGFAEEAVNNGSVKGVSLSLDKEETAKMQGHEDTDGMERHNIISDGNIVGYIDAAKGTNDPDTLYIHGISIDEKYQKQGIGTKALKELQQQTGTKDIRQTTGLTNAGKSFFKKYSSFQEKNTQEINTTEPQINRSEVPISPPEPAEIFIRPAERKDIGKASKSLAAVPDKEGYEKVYKKDGKDEGALQSPAEIEKEIKKIKKRIGTKKAAQRTKGAQNLVTRILELGGLRVTGKDYNTKLLRQDPDARRVLRMKSGLTADQLASRLQADGWQIESGDHLVELLKSGEGRTTFAPEIIDDKLNRQAERETNEWAEQQARELEAVAKQLESEGIDAGRIEASSESVRADLNSELEAEGYSPEQIEANAGEVDSFFDDIIKSNKPAKEEAPKDERPRWKVALDEVNSLLPNYPDHYDRAVATLPTQILKDIYNQPFETMEEHRGSRNPIITQTLAQRYNELSHEEQLKTSFVEWLNQSEVASQKEKTKGVLTAEQAVEKYKKTQIAEAEKNNRAGSWDLSTINNYADRIIKPYLDAIEKYPFKPENYYKKFLFRNSKDDIVGNARARAKEVGLLETAYDKEGNPFYALKGTAIPEGFYSEAFVTELDNKYNGWENIPEEEWGGAKKPAPKGEFKNSELEGFGFKDTFSLLNPETDMSKHKPLSEQKTAKNEEMFAENHIPDTTKKVEPKAKQEIQPKEETKETVKGVAMYNRNHSPARGIRSSQIQSVVDKATSFLKAAPKINVVQHISECPKAVLDDMERNGILDENGDADVQGFAWNGQVWLVGDNIDSPQEAVKILMHELTHDGLGKFLTSNTPNVKLRSIRLQYKSLMDAIYKAHEKEVKKIARTTHTHLDVSTLVGQRQAAEEWLCNQSYQSQPKWYDKLVTLFHDIVRAIGFDVKLSDAEVRTVLQDAFRTFKETGKKTIYIEKSPETALVSAARKEPGKYARSARALSIDEIIDKIIEDEMAASENMPNPETKESRLAVRLEKEAIAKALTTDFGELAEYKTMNMQEQADMAQDVMNNDYELAKRMAMGEIAPPPNVRAATMFEAVKIRALNEGDVDTLHRLATESTIPTILSQYGQEIKAADSYLIADPVKAMQDVIKHRIEEIKRTKGTKAAQASEIAELRKKLEEAEKKLADYEAKRDEKQVKEAIDEVIKRPKAKKKVLGQKNKIVTLEEFQQLREKMRKKAQGTQLNAGLDPTDLVDLAKMGVFYLEAGVREFASWSKQFTEDVGEWVAPHTKEIYEKSLDLYHDGIVQGIRDDVRQAVAADSNSDIGRYANELAKQFIEMGITDRETLIDQVHEVLKEEIPDLTRRNTMDAISGYGKYKPLNKDEISTILRDIKGQILQVAKLQDLQQGNPLLKTGWERQAPSDEERRLVKLVEDAKKKYGIETVDKERQLKSALDALKTRLKNQIKDLEYQIENRKKIVPVKHDIKRDAEAKALERQRENLKAQFDEIFGKSGMSDAQRQNIAIKSLEKSIVELYRRIQQKDLSPMKQPATPVTSPQIERLRKERESLRKEYKELKDLANPKKTPEEIALKSLKTRLKNEAKKYSEMLDNLNFEPRQRRQVIPDAEGKKLKEDRDRIKQAYQEASKVSSITKEEAENIVKLSKIVSETKENLEKGGNRFEYGAARVAFERYVEHLKGRDDTISKMLKDRMAEFKTTYKEHSTKAVYELLRDSIQTVADTSISMVASLDNSFIGRQGLKVLMTHPTVWWPAARESFRDIRKVMGGQNAMDALMADIYSRPNCLNGSYDIAKLIPKTEEQFPTSMPERVPYAGRMFKASQTAFEGAAIRMRTDLFDLLSQTGQEAGENVTDKGWVEDVGKLINSLTARGQWGKRGEPAIVRVILWAPKMLKANLDVLTAHGAGAGLETSFARKQAAFNLLKIVGSTAVLMAAAAAMGADVEDDPRSTDFGKIKVGDTRFDITGGAASIITLACRIAPAWMGGGKYKSASTGLIHEYGSKFADRTRWDAFIDFLTNKTSPPARVVVDMLKGRNWKGEPFTWSDSIYQALTPISIQNAIQLKDKSSADRIVGVLADVVGVNTQSFTASEKAWDEEQSKEMKQFHDRIGAEKFKEANKKYNDRVNAWYDSAKSSSHYQRLSDDQKEEAWRKERAKAKKAVFREYHFWPKRTK